MSDKKDFTRIVSYSQFSMYDNCQRQYKHRYIDKLSLKESSIHLIFGTAIHETVQLYLTTMYNKTRRAADEMNLEQIFLDELTKAFAKDKEKSIDNKNPATRLEMEEFYGDGRTILSYFRSNATKFYKKRGFELFGIELHLDNKLKEGLNFMGYIDVCLYNKDMDRYTIIDLKTSTKGWSKWQKNDKTKTSQLLLYKKFFSDKYNIPLDKIDVEYQILKRKLPDTDWPVPRISKFIPANGKPSTNKAYKNFMEFVDATFNEDGSFKDRNYPKNPGKNQNNCRFCEFLERGICDGKIN